MNTTLSEFARRYTESRPICAGYSNTLRKRAAALERFAGKTTLYEVLIETVVSAFLASLVCSPRTANKYRQDILSLWRAAADDDRVHYPNARRIKRCRTLPLIVECYVEEEARALVAAAARLAGTYPNGIARSLYWQAMIRAAWDTGLRRGDLWRLRRSQIRQDGTLIVAQSKTRRLVTCRVYPSTVAAIEASGGSLAWSLEAWSFGMHFREIVEIAGIGRGTFRWLRRGSGSRVDADHPGIGHTHLGQTRQVFDQHYNAHLGASSQPMPPEL